MEKSSPPCLGVLDSRSASASALLLHVCERGIRINFPVSEYRCSITTQPRLFVLSATFFPCGLSFQEALLFPLRRSNIANLGSSSRVALGRCSSSAHTRSRLRLD